MSILQGFDGLEDLTHAIIIPELCLLNPSMLLILCPLGCLYTSLSLSLLCRYRAVYLCLFADAFHFLRIPTSSPNSTPGADGQGVVVTVGTVRKTPDLS